MKVYQKKIDLQLEKDQVTAKELLKDGKKELVCICIMIII